MDAQTSPVADALASVVRDHGLRSTEDPVRTRALLTDALGEHARAFRAELDAVVLASEESVPATLTSVSEPGDTAALVRTLEARGLAPEMAAYAVATWAAVLAGPRRRSTTETATGTATGSSGTTGNTDVVTVGAASRPPRQDDVLLAPTQLPRDTVAPSPHPTSSPLPGPAAAPAAGGPPTGRGPGGPLTLLWSRPQVAAAVAGVGLVVAFALGYLVPRGDSIDAQPAAALPGPTTTVTTPGPEVTVTSTVRVTTRVTTVRTVDASKLRAMPATYRYSPAVAWTGQATCTEKRAPASATPVWCFHHLAVSKTGSLKSWAVVSAKVVSGPGTAKVGPKEVQYYVARNGPATVTIRYTILSGTVQSTSTVRVTLLCLKSYACGKALPS